MNRACQALGHNWTGWAYEPGTDTWWRTCTQCPALQQRAPTHPARRRHR